MSLEEMGYGVDEIRLTIRWKLLNLSDGYMGIHCIVYLYVFKIFHNE